MACRPNGFPQRRFSASVPCPELTSPILRWIMAEPAKKSKAKLILIAAGIVFVVIVAGLGYLGTVDMPPPKGKVEKTIPNDRFPK